MTRWVFVTGVCAALAWAVPAAAELPLKKTAPGDCCPGPRLCGCPDDYCRKPTPKIWCLGCGEPYCYCPKPIPCIRTLGCGIADDYCRKPCPDVCRPIRQDTYTCPPTTLPCARCTTLSFIGGPSPFAVPDTKPETKDRPTSPFREPR
jgi:hypothetical protein